MCVQLKVSTQIIWVHRERERERERPILSYYSGRVVSAVKSTKKSGCPDKFLRPKTREGNEIRNETGGGGGV